MGTLQQTGIDRKLEIPQRPAGRGAAHRRDVEISCRRDRPDKSDGGTQSEFDAVSLRIDRKMAVAGPGPLEPALGQILI